MKTTRSIVLMMACFLVLNAGTSCKLWNSVFGPKYGCPSNGKNVGAERILSGEKVPKARKFKV
ncbi:hypothetical protein HHL16_06270 [Pseudoflavitalea sp. G-6-1-2]|uniref:hypothetical protein n=1 Tax=Pseudoflavitalea sp. G-6-1-2 TaxID=2728841 RepID=UPI001469FF32|nr:hypothetical protein [Pseudoflavitalea sp. G-6-1-2]NML20469.1 hypothetical protein [Pseudoflavitalea sp. G-6-1-2]